MTDLEEKLKEQEKIDKKVLKLLLVIDIIERPFKIYNLDKFDYMFVFMIMHWI